MKWARVRDYLIYAIMGAPTGVVMSRLQFHPLRGLDDWGYYVFFGVVINVIVGALAYAFTATYLLRADPNDKLVALLWPIGYVACGAVSCVFLITGSGQ